MIGSRSFPSNFTPAEQACLKGSAIVGEVLSVKNFLKSEYEMISQKVPEFKQFPYELYASAMLMAQSRSL